MLLKEQNEANLRKELKKKSTLTVKKSDAMKQSDLNTHMRHQSTNDQTLSADAHLAMALRAMPFELKDTAIPTTLLHAEAGEGLRGRDFVQYSSAQGGAEDRNDIHNKDQFESKSQEHKDDNTSRKKQKKSRGEYKSIWKLIQSYIHSPKDAENTKTDIVNATVSTQRIQMQRKALYHLEEAAELGNSQAQNILANILSSGILPFDDHPEFRRSGNSNGTLDVQADFAEGSEQLARAIMLWHLSAMDGNIEASITLGYRHYISATTGSDKNRIITEDMTNVHHPVTQPLREGPDDTSGKQTKNSKPMMHSPSASAHYGALGTCESSLAYYEAAANAIMDELETSPLRGKVAPARDHHNLAEIHQRGTSSRLAHHNKPDELEEAITYYKMRANNPQNPDINAAYKVANMYHYGLRGVQQDMREALKYYEVAGDLNSWEAGGQAGKFHLWGMGLDDEERNMNKALEYFRRGTPGGLVGCRVSSLAWESRLYDFCTHLSCARCTFTASILLIQ